MKINQRNTPRRRAAIVAVEVKKLEKKKQALICWHY